MSELKTKALEQLSEFLELTDHQKAKLEPIIDDLEVIDLVKPLIARDLRKGKSCESIRIRYKVEPWVTRRFGIKIGLYKPEPSRSRMGVKP